MYSNLHSLRWQPQIGDPSIMGWVVVFFYFVTSALAVSIALGSLKDKTYFRFWGLLAIFLLLLGINKQLDIQSLITEIGRIIAREQGWYSNRRSVQLIFVVILSSISLFAMVSFWWILSKEWQKYLIPITGFIFLISFIIIRAASFHHVDWFLKNGPFGIRMNWILELSGIGIIFCAEIVDLIKKHKCPIYNIKHLFIFMST